MGIGGQRGASQEWRAHLSLKEEGLGHDGTGRLEPGVGQAQELVMGESQQQ